MISIIWAYDNNWWRFGFPKKKNLLSDSKIEFQVSDVSKISSLPKTIDWNPQSDVSKKANCLKKFVQTSITFLNFILAKKKFFFAWGSPAGYELLKYLEWNFFRYIKLIHNALPHFFLLVEFWRISRLPTWGIVWFPAAF